MLALFVHCDSVQTKDSCHGGGAPSVVLPSISHTHTSAQPASRIVLSDTITPAALHTLHTFSFGLHARVTQENPVRYHAVAAPPRQGNKKLLRHQHYMHTQVTGPNNTPCAQPSCKTAAATACRGRCHYCCCSAERLDACPPAALLARCSSRCLASSSNSSCSHCACLLLSCAIAASAAPCCELLRP